MLAEKMLFNNQISDPFRRLDNLIRLIDQNAEGNWPFGSVNFSQCLTNVWEDECECIIEMELAGVLRNNLNLSVEGPQISVQFNNPEPDDEAYRRYLRHERLFGCTTRIISLPFETDLDKMNVELADGLLTLHVRRA